MSHPITLFSEFFCLALTEIFSFLTGSLWTIRRFVHQLPNISRNRVIIEINNVQILFYSLEAPVFHWRKMLFVSSIISALEQEDLLQLSILQKISLKRNEIFSTNKFLNKYMFFRDQKGED